jgi:hypothetical protein
VSNGVGAAEAAQVLDERELDRVIAGPRFEAAARGAVDCWIPTDGDDGILLLRDIGRFVAAQWTFFLASEPEGLTRSRLEDLLKATNASGVARAQALLIYLRFIGYVAPAPTGDSRVKRYVPTPVLIGVFTARLKRELAWAADLDPDTAALAARFDEPDVADAFRRCHAQNTIALFKLHTAEEVSLDVFSHRFGGMTILGALLQAADQGGAFPAEGVARFNVSHLSRMADCSRTQVRNQLRAAQKAGLLTDVGEGEARLTPLLLEHVRHLIAGSALLFAWGARRALAEIEGR